jgi:uncharacterized membrane protein
VLSLGDCRYAFIVVGLIGVLAFNVPSLMLFVHLPGGERFSELYVLGPGHMAEGYPFNVGAGVDYSVFLGVGNHLGGSASYQVVVKMRNATEPLPNATSGAQSPLPMLYAYEVFLAEGQTWEEALVFRFDDVAFGVNVSSVGRIRVNDAWMNVNETAVWDEVNNAYYYQVFVELRLYNATSNSFGFHNRFVSRWLNMTSSL